MDRRLGHIQHHVEGAKSRMEAAPITLSLQRKLNELKKMLKHCFLGGQSIKDGYLLFAGGFWKPTPAIIEG